MLYETCEEVNEEFWEELAQLPPGEVSRRSGAVYQEGLYRLPFLNRILFINPGARRLRIEGAEAEAPGFRLCLTALLYLSRVDPAGLGPLRSPKELTGGATFFMNRGPHALPAAPLEERFGHDLPGFLAAGQALGGEPRTHGDAGFSFRVFPGLPVEVILWLADEEFPAQVSFRVPGSLERVWHLDAVLGLLQLLAEELLRAAA